MNGATTVFTMDDVALQTGAANSFAIVNGETIQAQIGLLRARTMIRTPPAGEVAVETLSTGKRVITLIDGAAVPPSRPSGQAIATRPDPDIRERTAVAPIRIPGRRGAAGVPPP